MSQLRQGSPAPDSQTTLRNFTDKVMRSILGGSFGVDLGVVFGGVHEVFGAAFGVVVGVAV